MLEEFQVVMAAVVPLNVTLPGLAPKFAPVIVTVAPTTPPAGDKVEMLGAAAQVSPASSETRKIVRPKTGFQFRMFISATPENQYPLYDSNRRLERTNRLIADR
jgi:hypothetical protein